MQEEEAVNEDDPERMLDDKMERDEMVRKNGEPMSRRGGGQEEQAPSQHDVLYARCACLRDIRATRPFIGCRSWEVPQRRGWSWPRTMNVQHVLKMWRCVWTSSMLKM